MHVHVYLVGGLNPSEKYDFVSWEGCHPIYEMEKIEFMFQSPPASYSVIPIINHY
jgi:hypothetical protein